MRAFGHHATASRSPCQKMSRKAKHSTSACSATAVVDPVRRGLNQQALGERGHPSGSHVALQGNRGPLKRSSDRVKTTDVPTGRWLGFHGMGLGPCPALEGLVPCGRAYKTRSHFYRGMFQPPQLLGSACVKALDGQKNGIAPFRQRARVAALTACIHPVRSKYFVVCR